MSAPKRIALMLSEMNPTDAGNELKRYYKLDGAPFVEDILMILQDYNTKEWWLDMMYTAGDEISSLY